MFPFIRRARGFPGPLLALTLILCVGCFVSCLTGAEAVRRPFALAAGGAEATLEAFSVQADAPVVFPLREVRGVTTNPVHGDFAPREALQRLVAGTGLEVKQNEDTGTFVVRRERPALPPQGPPQHNDSPPMKRYPFFSLLAGWFAVVPIDGDAQTAKAAKVPTSAEVVELSPFVVVTEKDTSWFASNTLAGSRMNSPLTDVAASLDVFTADFIQDLGATDLNELNRYAINHTDSTTLGAGNLDPQVISNSGMSVRGLATTTGRNYFPWPNPTDLYNIDRVEQARGPNGILFGVGSAGGITTSTTKRAAVNRSSGSIQFEGGSYEYQRSSLDYNHVLRKDRLALRLNLMKQLSHSAVSHEETDRDGVALAGTWRPFAHTTITAGFESFNYYNSQSSRTVPGDRSSYWEAQGSKQTPKIGGGNTNPYTAADQNSFGITSTGTNQLWTFISNGGVPLINTRNMATAQAFNASHPDPVSGTTGDVVATRFRGIERVNTFGPSSFRSMDIKDYSLNIEQRVSKGLYAEAAYDQYYSDWNGYRTNPPVLQADPNAFLPNGATNPYAGQHYLQNNWLRDLGFRNGERWRISASYEANFGARFGRHRLAASYEGAEEELQAGRYFENYTVNGRLFNADPNNGNNRVAYRTYVDPHDPSTVAFGPRTFVPYSWTDAAGNSYQTYWARNTVNGTDSTTRSRARMVADQVYFLRDKLVITGGYREEDLRFLNRAAYVRSADGLEYVRPAASVFSSVNSILRTKTLGGVMHFNPSFSAFANISNNNGPASQLAVELYPDGRPAPSPQGRGRDLGFMVNLVKNRLAFRVTHYETSATKERFTGGVLNNVTLVNQNVMDRLLDPAGNGDPAFGGVSGSDSDRYVSVADYNSRLFRSTGSLRDSRSKGYELQIQGQPLEEWNVRLTYAHTKVKRANVAPELVEWWSGARPYFAAFPQTLLVSGTNTLAQTIATLDNYFTNSILIPQETSVGYRLHNANFISSYAFRQGRLNGFTVGGGARYQSRNVIGVTASGGNIYGEPLFDLDVFAKYTTKGPRDTRVTCQVNGAGVNRGDFKLVPISINAAKDGADAVTVLFPATWKASVRLDF